MDYRSVIGLKDIQDYIEMVMYINNKIRKGELIDVRPMHLCPSYENLKQKSLRELLELLMTALKNQIGDYKEQDIEHIDQKYLEYLENQLQKTTKQQKALLDKISMLKQNGK